jgi:hypothetical protein
LDGCASIDAKQFTWRITDTLRKSTATVGPLAACSTIISVPRLDVYPITLVVSDGARSDSMMMAVHVKDLLIVSLGDSYASGEGNPDIAQSGVAIDYLGISAGVLARIRVAHRPVWQDRRCDRSGWAGPAQAALQIAKSDPARHASVTFLSFACSGAGIFEGIIHAYRGIDDAGLPAGVAPLRPQLEQLALALCGAPNCRNQSKSRSIDDLLISAGGNDLGFGDIVAKCVEIDLKARHGFGALVPGDLTGEVLGLVPFCAADTTMTAPLQRKFDVVAARYDSLADSLGSKGKDLIDPATIVFVTEYPDPSHAADGRPCGYPPPSNVSVIDIPVIGATIDGRTANWVATALIPQINHAVEQAARNRWHYVSGISSPFGQHGMCAGDKRWFRTFDEALVLQTPIDFTWAPFTANGLRIPAGTLHPNTEGNRVYADQLVAAMGHKPGVRPVLSVDASRAVAGVASTIGVSLTHPQRGAVAGRARIDDGEWFPVNTRKTLTLHGAKHYVVVEANEYPAQGGVFQIQLRKLAVHFEPDPIPRNRATDLKVFAVNDSGRHIDGVVRIYQPARPPAKSDEIVLHTDSTLKGFVAAIRTVVLRNPRVGGVSNLVFAPTGEVFPADSDYGSATFSLVDVDTFGDAGDVPLHSTQRDPLLTRPARAVPVGGNLRLTRK